MCASYNKSFVPPDSTTRTKALGETNELTHDLRQAVTVGIDECFLPFGKPKPGDWVTIHSEPGQTVMQFERQKRTVPQLRRRIIYVQPIGSFDYPRAPSMESICEFSRPYFPACDFEILPQVEFSAFSKRENEGKRINGYTKQPQYLTSFIIENLKRMRQKQRKHDLRELFCIGVTMADIYPDSSWNFVYGLADEDEGIGIYSFARFDPLFPDALKTTTCTDEERALILKRAVATFIHEIIHLFGVDHCIYYSCLMNGTESESEMDTQPLYLCPVCLRKMYAAMGQYKTEFNVIRMYTKLVELCQKFHFKDELAWYEKRLNVLTATQVNRL